MVGAQHRWDKQIFRFAAVGIAANIFGYIIYLLVTTFWVSPKEAVTLLYALGAAIGFYGNKRITFAHKGDLLTSGFRYLLAHAMGYLLNLGLLVVFTDYFGFPHQIVQAAAIFVVAGFLFIVFKAFVFANG